MTVIRPNSISGVASITAHGGDITYFKSDGTRGNQFTHNVSSTGVITATKFVGPIEGNITGATASFTGDVGVGGVLTYEDVTNVDSVGVITARDGIRCTGIVTATAFHGDGSSLTGVGASFGNSSVNSSGIATFSAFVPTSQEALSHRNRIINGAMQLDHLMILYIVREFKEIVVILKLIK